MSKKLPRVGIILQAYNQGKYVDDAIKSLRAQTFQDFEINLVDDGSNDGYTSSKLASLEYDKIAYKNLYKVNKGTAFRQRQQYKIMNNEFVMILCGDDMLAPTFLEKTVEYMDSHKNCGAVSTDILIWFSGDPTPTPPNFISKVDSQELTLPKVIAHANFLGSALMRKKALDELDLSPKFKRYQDWDRWVSLLEHGWSLGNISEPLFYYRQLPTSLAHSATIEDEIAVRRVFFDMHKKSIADNLEEYYLAIEKKHLSAVKEMDQRCLELFEQNNSLLQEIEALKLQCEKSKSFYQKIKNRLKNFIARR